MYLRSKIPTHYITFDALIRRCLYMLWALNARLCSGREHILLIRSPTESEPNHVKLNHVVKPSHSRILHAVDPSLYDLMGCL